MQIQIGVEPDLPLSGIRLDQVIGPLLNYLLVLRIVKNGSPIHRMKFVEDFILDTFKNLQNLDPQCLGMGGAQDGAIVQVIEFFGHFPQGAWLASHLLGRG